MRPAIANTPEAQQGQMGIRMGRNVFWQSVAILIGLIVLSGILTQMVPAGAYERIEREGRMTVVPGSFRYLDLHEGQDYALWRIATAPFELFASNDAGTVVAIISFILLIGGAFSVFNETGVFGTMIDGMLNRFRAHRTALIAVFSLFFMLMGAVFGILEEVVPLIPLMILVARRLGWNDLMGLGLSLLPAGFGFSAALTNPFTIGAAQRLADVPIFSGMLYRVVIFALTYAILVAFLVRYARKLDRSAADTGTGESLAPLTAAEPGNEADGQAPTPKQAAAVQATSAAFGVILLLIIVLPLAGLADYAMPIIAVGMTLAAAAAALILSLPWRRIGAHFGAGVVALAPSAVLIVLAMSVKHIFEASRIMDSVLHVMTGAMEGMGSVTGAIVMYLLVFVLQFFIPSATAKTFLTIPLLTPLGDLLGITRQSVVLAFNFGDGFSHLLYPSNPMLLIALSMTTVSYMKWLRWTLGIQALLFVITVLLLALAVVFRYGPV